MVQREGTFVASSISFDKGKDCRWHKNSLMEVIRTWLPAILPNGSMFGFYLSISPISRPRGRGEKVKEMGEWVQVLVQENLQSF